jgi:hypothetical protein
MPSNFLSTKWRSLRLIVLHPDEAILILVDSKILLSLKEKDFLFSLFLSEEPFSPEAS